MSTDEELRAYREEGYVLLPGVVEPARCEHLIARLSHQIERIGALYASGARKAAYWAQMPRSLHELDVFWEDDRGPFVESRVTRVGHVLHVADPDYAELVVRSPLSPVLAAYCPTVVQSAVVYKQPASSAVQFGPHQDTAYLHAEPDHGVALVFVALEDTDAENGALEVVPRSHLRGQGERLRLEPSGFVPMDGRDAVFDPRERVLLPMRRGDVAVVQGHTYHASKPNRSARTRRALTLHGLAHGARLAPTSWVHGAEAGFVTVVPPDGR